MTGDTGVPDGSAELAFMPVSQLAQRVSQGDVSPRDLVETSLNRIASLDPHYRAFIRVDAGAALGAANAAEQAIRRGRPLGPLHGIPFAWKDQFYVQGVAPTCGSRVELEARRDVDATAIRRLREAGAIALGTLNLNEFGLGEPFDPPYGRPRNPWDTGRSAGGSSNGSAVAVAAGLCPASVGEDTNGSIRGPAAFTGIVGLRPSWGRVSRHGLVATSPSQDTVGPMARTVRDTAILLGVMAGADRLDPTCARKPVPRLAERLDEGISGTRLGLLTERLAESELPIEPSVLNAVNAAVEVLRSAGGAPVDVSVPSIRHAGLVSTIVAMVERAAVHATRLRDQLGSFDYRSQVNLVSGALLSAQDYYWARRMRATIATELRDALRIVDVLVLPTSPEAAPPVSDVRPPGAHRGVLPQFQNPSVGFRVPFGLAGLPAASVPCGFTDDGLPIGLQIVGRPFEDLRVLQVAHAFERATEWHLRRPPILEAVRA